MAPGFIPLLICVDVEPDGRSHPEAKDGWRGVGPTSVLLEQFRKRFAAATGVAAKLNWFVRADPMIESVYGRPDYAIENHSETFARARSAGDSIGVHVHPYRRESGEWVQAFGDPEWVAVCVRSSIADARRSFGSCDTFRFGDHWMGDSAISLVESLGVRFDLTLAPGRIGTIGPPGEKHTGEFPDTRLVPRVPYHPSRRDYRRPGRVLPRRITLFPVSTGEGIRRKNRLMPDDGSEGEIRFEPDPLPLDGKGLGACRVLWKSSCDAIDLRVDSPDGPLFCGGGARGEAATGAWVRYGTRFYLRSSVDGRTLAAKTVRSCTHDGRILNEANAFPLYARQGEACPLDLSMPPEGFASVLDECLERADVRHVQAVVRTDAGANEERARNMRDNLDLLVERAATVPLRAVTPHETHVMTERKTVSRLQPRRLVMQ